MMATRKDSSAEPSAPIASVRDRGMRKNIPPEALRDFVAARRESEGGMWDEMPGVAVALARRSVAMAMEAVYG